MPRQRNGSAVTVEHDYSTSVESPRGREDMTAGSLGCCRSPDDRTPSFRIDIASTTCASSIRHLKNTVWLSMPLP
jgi:hypothetical protein